MSSFALDLWLEVAKVVVGAAFTVVIGIVGYYLRHEYKEHRKNTAVRRWLVGDPQLEEVDDEGQLEEIDDRFEKMSQEMEDRHEAIASEVHETKTLVERIAYQLESHPEHDFVRGGGRDRDRTDPSGGAPSDD